MYHAVVRRIVRRTFYHLNRADYAPVVAMYDPQIVHTFAGDHALSGERRSVPAVKQWYDRLFRVFGQLRFSVQEVIVQGLPWNTSVAVKVNINATLSDGNPYSNVLAMFVELRWGRITAISMHEDAQKLARTLKEIAAQGVAEAAAAPIVG
jgi:ketosteroid isomerase-like protein